MSSAEKEIDLVQFLVDFIQFLKAGKKVILSFLIISILISFFSYKFIDSSKSVVYEKSVIFTSTLVQNDLLVDVLNSIDKQNHKRRAKQLNISESVSEKISNIDVVFSPFSGQNVGEVNNSKIEVIFRYTDLKSFSSLVDSVMKFCEKNTYFKSKFNLFMTQNVELLELVKRKMNKPISSDVQFFEDGVIYRSNSIELFYLLKQKQSIEKALNLVKLIKIINVNNEIIYLKPFSLGSKTLIYVCVGFVLSILFLFINLVYKRMVLIR